MKRGGGGGDGSFNKRSRQEDLEGKLEIRLLVVSKCVGGVIGKGGENIKRLRSHYDCSLTVQNSNAPERILTIIAEEENAYGCLREVFPKLDESRAAEDDIEIRQLVHQSHAGAIIGRSGLKIKELRESSDTQMKIFAQPCPMSSDRVMQIIGKPEKVVSAMKAVYDLISELPIKGSNKPYDTLNYDPSMAYECGGYGGSFGGRGGPGPDGPWGRGPLGGSLMRGGGYGGRGVMGGGFIGGAYGGGGLRGGLGGGAYGGGGNYSGGGPNHSTQVTIPSDLGGTIIGRNGERINRIREDSGANIQMDPPSQDERIITISGTQSQIQMAQYMLQECIRSSQAGRRYIESQQVGY